MHGTKLDHFKILISEVYTTFHQPPIDRFQTFQTSIYLICDHSWDWIWTYPIPVDISHPFANGGMLHSQHVHPEHRISNTQDRAVRVQVLLMSFSRIHYLLFRGINNTAIFQYEKGKERILRWLDFRGR